MNKLQPGSVWALVVVINAGMYAGLLLYVLAKTLP